MSKIKSYLEQIISLNLGDTQKRLYEDIITSGKSFNVDLFNIDRGLDHYCKINDAKAKECFKNSLLLALTYDNIQYVEGYMYSKELGFPIEHAWNTSSELDIIDTTMHINETGIQVNEFFGVTIPKEVLLDYIETDQILTALQYYSINK